MLREDSFGNIVVIAVTLLIMLICELSFVSCFSFFAVRLVWCLCSVVSKESICHTIRIMLMKPTHMNMVDILTIRRKDMVVEVADLAAGRPGVIGEGISALLHYVLILHQWNIGF